MSTWKTKYGWRCKFQHNHEWQYAPTYFTSKRAANIWKKEEKARLKEAENAAPTSPGLYDLAQLYLDEAQLRYSHNTYVEKCTCLERLCAVVGDVQPDEVTPADIAALLVARAKKVSPNASNRERKNIKAFFRWMHRTHGLIHDPTALIDKLPHEKKARRVIPIQDILSVIMAAPMPERAMIAAYWHTGARRGEVLRWTWADDVSLEGRWVRLGTRKKADGSMSYEKLWMNQDLFNLLTDLWRNHRDPNSPYLFPYYHELNDRGQNLRGEQRAHRLLVGYTKQLKTKKGENREKRYPGLCEKAGVQIFGYHDIRHTVAAYLNDVHKVGIKKVQRVLRHRRQTTTEIYLEGDYTTTQSALELLETQNVNIPSNKVAPKVTPSENKGLTIIG